MGQPVLILGESGSGKTFSIKNFDPNEVGIFAVEKSRLPFRKEFKVAKNATYETIMNCFKNGTKLKAYCFCLDLPCIRIRLGMMQEVNYHIIRELMVYVMDKVSEMDRYVGELSVTGILCLVEHFIYK